MAYQPDDEIGTTFQWHGGEYIEIGTTDEMGFTALDVINVWDYRAGAPRIARTLEAFQERCDEWISVDREWLEEADELA
jgi:hypothetical protein